MSDEPKLLALLCSWCSYAAADGAGAAHSPIPPNLTVIRVACTGRVDPSWVLRAFRAGMDGVLVSGCHPGSCHYVDGNTKALGRMTLLQSVLQQWGIEADRLRVEWIGASEAVRFGTVAREFEQRIRSLGPLRSESEVSRCRS